jgi:hypothetical protein
VASEAVRLLDGLDLVKGHFPGRPEVLWGWRSSKDSPAVGAMLYE